MHAPANIDGRVGGYGDRALQGQRRVVRVRAAVEQDRPAVESEIDERVETVVRLNHAALVDRDCRGGRRGVVAPHVVAAETKRGRVARRRAVCVDRDGRGRVDCSADADLENTVIDGRCPGVRVCAGQCQRPVADLGQRERAASVTDNAEEGTGGVVVAGGQRRAAARALYIRGSGCTAQPVNRLIEPVQIQEHVLVRRIEHDVALARPVGDHAGCAEPEGG